MGFKMRGAPMHRNFKVGKPGPPSDTDATEVDNGTTSWVNKDGSDKNQNKTPDEKSSTVVGKNSTDLNLGAVVPETKVVKDEKPKAKDYDDKGGKNNSKEGDDKVANFMNKPILQVLGLTKKQREARKVKKDAKRDAKLSDATTAVKDGTQTLKQQKYVDRTNKKSKKKEDKASKKRTKDQEKLVKYKARKSKKAAKKFKKNTVVKNGKTYDKSKNTTTSTKPTDAELMAHHEANRKKKGKSTE